MTIARVKPLCACVNTKRGCAELTCDENDHFVFSVLSLIMEKNGRTQRK